MSLQRKTEMGRGTKGLAPGKGLTTRTPMKRGTPLTTRKPMDRGAGLAQGGGLTRSAPAPRAAPPATRATAPRKAPTNTGPTPAVRALARDRDGGLCVRCGAPATNLDHRRNRGAGGTHGEMAETINGAAWLLTTCGMGNTSGCHKLKDDDVEAARRGGFRIDRHRVFRAAELVPVRTAWGWRLYANDGTWRACDEPPEGDARNAA